MGRTKSAPRRLVEANRDDFQVTSANAADLVKEMQASHDVVAEATHVRKGRKGTESSDDDFCESNSDTEDFDLGSTDNSDSDAPKRRKRVKQKRPIKRKPVKPSYRVPQKQSVAVLFELSCSLEAEGLDLDTLRSSVCQFELESGVVVCKMFDSRDFHYLGSALPSDVALAEPLVLLQQKHFVNVRVNDIQARALKIEVALTDAVFADEHLAANDETERPHNRFLKALLLKLVPVPNSGVLGFDPSRLYANELATSNAQAPIDQPAQLLPALRPYQRRAVGWMVDRERNPTGAPQQTDLHPLWQTYQSVDGTVLHVNIFSGRISRIRPTLPVPVETAVHGGILADEMGLGKTLEVLSCVFANPQPAEARPKPPAVVTDVNDEDDTVDIMSPDDQSVPMQIKEDPASVAVLPERIACVCGVTSDDGSNVGWVQCDSCDIWQHIDCVGYSDGAFTCAACTKPKRKRHRAEESDEEFAMSELKHSKAQASRVGYHGPIAARTTLIVSPASILDQWKQEIDRHVVPGTLRVKIYGGCRAESVTGADLAQHDIVLTTYDVLRSDLYHVPIDADRNMRFDKKWTVHHTPLTELVWWRVCLDEAQMVENTTARAADMALHLHCVNRWCVSGTPIQRGLDDLYGLFRFLQLPLWSSKKWWSKAIEEPYQQGSIPAEQRLHVILKALLWRNSKATVADELQLPAQRETVVKLRFSAVEAYYYRRQHDDCSVQVQQVLRKAIARPVAQAPAADEAVGAPEAAACISPLPPREAAARAALLRAEQVSGVSLEMEAEHTQPGDPAEEAQQVMLDDGMQIDVDAEVPLDDEVARNRSLARTVSRNNAASKLFGNAMLRLRQACCHPQVGGAGARSLSLQRNAMTMEELLQHMIENAKVECEEAQRFLILSLNGLAAIEWIRGKHLEAANCYRTALRIGDENKQRTDPLQLLHIYVNFAQLLSEHGDQIGRTVRDASLLPEAERIRLKYSADASNAVVVANQRSREARTAVNSGEASLYEHRRFNDRRLPWWSVTLGALMNQTALGSEFVTRVQRELSSSREEQLAQQGYQGQANPFQFRDLAGLQYCLHQELEGLDQTRKRWLESLDALSRDPTQDDVQISGHCKTCRPNKQGPTCEHCEAHLLLEAYEHKLFAYKQQTANPLANKFDPSVERSRRERASTAATHIGVWKESQAEQVLRLLSKHASGNLAKEASDHFDVLSAMKKEFKRTSQLWQAQKDRLSRLDELGMATIRMRVRAAWEDVLPGEEIFKLKHYEVEPTAQRLLADRRSAEAQLKRTLGQLQYLSRLKAARQPKNASEPGNNDVAEANMCAVCQDEIGDDLVIFLCGHTFCYPCVQMMVEAASKRHAQTLACPTCRDRINISDLTYVSQSVEQPVPANIATEIDQQLTTPTPSALSEDIVMENLQAPVVQFLPVKGSWGTKIEAVVRCILQIAADEKIIVFSQWSDVLELISRALSANDVHFVRAAGQRAKFHKQLQDFKLKPEVRALLLPVAQGANGLNIVEATHVILVEPLLNPGMELQAINRVHRIGQTKETYVHRFIVTDTIEERIYQLSRDKQGREWRTREREKDALTMNELGWLFERGQMRPPN